MAKYRCHGCGFCFATKQQLGGHLSKGVSCSLGPVLITKPFFPAQEINSPFATPVATASIVATSTDNVIPSATITVPAVPASINELLQRPCHDEAKHRVVPATLPYSREEADLSRAFKLYEVCLLFIYIVMHVTLACLLQTQEAYKEYCTLIREKYSDKFWKFFGSVYTERNSVIDRVLSACRNTYVHNKAKFPNSVRGLRHCAHQIGNFNLN